MVSWLHQFNGHEFEQTLGDTEGQEAWHAAVHRSQLVGNDLAIKQQQQKIYEYLLLFRPAWLFVPRKIPSSMSQGERCIPLSHNCPTVSEPG